MSAAAAADRAWNLRMENGSETIQRNASQGASPSDVVFPYRYLYISLSSIGVVVNLLVFVLLRWRKVISGQIPRLLLTNQCICDMMAGGLNALIWIIGYEFTVPPNPLGDAICRVWYTGFFMWSCSQSSVANLVLLTMERYLSVVHPAFHRCWVTKRRICILAVCCWLLGPSTEWGSLFLAERTERTCRSIHMDPIPQITWGILIFCSFLLLPFPVLLYCNCRMIVVLRKQQEMVHRYPSYLSRVTRQLSFTVAVAGISYFCSFAPSLITFCLHIFSFGAIAGDDWFYEFTTVLVNLNFVLNPTIYVVSVYSFRHELRKMLTCASSKTTSLRRNDSNERLSDATRV